ncbi:MAG: NUDIX domain-containing protein [Candidatus Nealsonbacteria bacterium]|nr:NUDIX domain-containing protein [Candidatus Nealsonbacteria bacterium]
MDKNNFQKAVKALIFSQGKYLILFKSTIETSPMTWDFPGGQVEVGESLVEALQREVKEETGIDVIVSSAWPVKKWTFEKDGVHTDGTDFFCIIPNRLKIKLSHEHSDFRWLTENKIIKDKKIPSWLKDTVRLASKNMSNRNAPSMKILS